MISLTVIVKSTNEHIDIYSKNKQDNTPENLDWSGVKQNCFIANEYANIVIDYSKRAFLTVRWIIMLQPWKTNCIFISSITKVKLQIQIFHAIHYLLSSVLKFKIYPKLPFDCSIRRLNVTFLIVVFNEFIFIKLEVIIVLIILFLVNLIVS